MLVNATDFKNKVGKYLKLANEEEVVITKNGKKIIKLVPFDDNSTPITNNLRGMFKECEDVDLEKEIDERLSKYEDTY